jgi:neutral amino acid transport system permease protein
VEGRVAAPALGVLLAPAAAYAQGESVRGTLCAPDGKTVAGVTLTATRNGAEIGKDTTASDGKWEIALPGAGRYTITLDVATLPAGLNPAREGGQTLRNVPVPEGESRAVIFQLTTGTPAPGPSPGQSGGGGGGPPQNAGTPWLDRVAQSLVEGIKFGSIIAITAVGLLLIFGTTGLINFAHGEMGHARRRHGDQRLGGLHGGGPPDRRGPAREHRLEPRGHRRLPRRPSRPPRRRGGMR